MDKIHTTEFECPPCGYFEEVRHDLAVAHQCPFCGCYMVKVDEDDEDERTEMAYRYSVESQNDVDYDDRE